MPIECLSHVVWKPRSSARSYFARALASAVEGWHFICVKRFTSPAETTTNADERGGRGDRCTLRPQSAVWNGCPVYVSSLSVRGSCCASLCCNRSSHSQIWFSTRIGSPPPSRQCTTRGSTRCDPSIAEVVMPCALLCGLNLPNSVDLNKVVVLLMQCCAWRGFAHLLGRPGEARCQ